MSEVKRIAVDACLVLVAVFAPAESAMITVMVLPLADLALALLCVKRAKQPLTSAGLKRTVAKILMYEAATALAFMTEQFLTGPAVPAMRLVTGLIGLTELKSCLEHLDSLSGGSLFKTIVDRLSPASLKPPSDPPESSP